MPKSGRYRSEAYARLAGLLEAEGRVDDALELLKQAVQSEIHARQS